MSAFLTLYFVIEVASMPGVGTITAIRLPWADVESCNAYLANPEPFKAGPGIVRVLGGECTTKEPTKAPEGRRT